MPAQMTHRAPYAALALPPVVSGLALAVYVGTKLVGPVIALYWLAVLAVLGTLFLVRRLPMWWAISTAASVALLVPVTRSALSWTAWSIGGFAP
jgi:hypothetical protein